MLLRLKRKIIEINSNKYFINTKWLLGERIFRMLIGLFVGVWIARYLGPEKLGVLSYSQSIVGILSVVATLGIDNVLVRELVNNEDEIEELLGTGFAIKLFGSLVLIVLLGIFIYFNNEGLEISILIITIGLSYIFRSINVIDFFFQSKSLNKYVVIANFSSLLLASIIKIFLILKGYPLIYFGFVSLFESVIVASGLLYYYITNNGALFKWSFKVSLAKDILRSSLPLLFTTLMISLYTQLDQVMINKMTSSIETGYYAVALRINNIWSFIPSIILVSVTPAIYKAKEVSDYLFEKRLQHLYQAFVVYGFIILILVLLFGNFIVLKLFGEDYKDSVLIIQLLALGNIFSFLGAASSRWYMKTNNENYIMYRSILGVSVNIIGNYIFIPIYGAIGSAVTTVFSQISANLIFDIFFKKTRIVFKQKVAALFLYKIF